MPVPGVATVSQHVRAATRLAPGRPAVWLGLRTAAATALPLALAPWLAAPLATWAPIAGYGVALADKGGAYRTRARTMAGVALGSLLAVALGTLVAGSAPLAIAVVTLGAAAGAFGHAWGAPGASIGNAITIHLTIATVLPAAPGAAPLAVAGFAAGAGWAMFLGLVVWPVRVYKPGRRAAAATLTALAEHAGAVARLRPGDPAARDELAGRHRAIRDELERARAILVATRRGRRGESGRGERLLAIVHAADRLFGALVSLEELLDAGAAGAAGPAVTAGLDELATALHELAARVLLEARQPPARTPTWDPEAATAALAAEPVAARALAAHAIVLLGHADDERDRAGALIDSLVDDAEPVTDRLPAPEPGRSVGERLRATLDLDSAVLRHALRVALCVCAAATIAARLHLHHGYWITTTTFLLLQPNRSATATRTVQRGVGTVVGAIVAAAIAYLVQAPLPMMVIIVALAGLGASVLQLNYALYSMFVTPTFVLLAEVHSHDFTLVEVRVAYTLLAGVLAFAASALLWPGREHVHVREQLAQALAAGARYLAAVHRAIARATPPPSPEVVACRRGFGLAINNAELALDRVFGDGGPPGFAEAGMTMVAATRRLGGAINAFGSSRAIADHDEAALAAFAAVAERLSALAAGLRAGTPPPPWSRAELAIADPVVAARLGRLEAPLARLTDAVARAAGTA